MKNILKTALCLVAVLSVLMLSGCGEKTVKFGVGSYKTTETKDSLEGGDGKSKTEVIVATVLLDNGKIADCVIDSIDVEAKFNKNGEAYDLGELKSKYQLGEQYGMKKYGNSKGEWYEEVDGFIEVVKGKTLTDVKALVATNKKGTDDVIKAGCTIEIDGLVMAIEKAVNNAKEVDANSDSSLKLRLSAKQTKKQSATDQANGEIGADVSYKASLIDKGGREIETQDKTVTTTAKFDTKGANIK